MTDEQNYDFKIRTLIRCQKCDRKMRLLGVEPLEPARELYTFECGQCGELEFRGVRTG